MHAQRLFTQNTIFLEHEMKDLERDVELFVRNYVSALEKLVQEKYQQVKSIEFESFFPIEFPVKAVAYLGKRGILLNFEKADRFSILIKKNERPQAKSHWGEFIFYSRFSRIKERASEKAESDIKYFLSMPKLVEEHEKEMERYYEARWFEEMSYTIQHYLEFLSKAKDVVDETRHEVVQEVYQIIEIVQNHLSNFEYMLQVGCKALNNLYFMINSDLETSFFLALNGKYFAAVAILRKILEVNLRCAYLDSLQDRALAARKTDDWIGGGRFPWTFRHIVNSLMSDRIDHNLTDLLKGLGILKNGSFKQSTLLLYERLCVFVHLRPQMSWGEDLRISFSKFDVEKFRAYYSLLMEVVKISEILLILKFPRIVSIRSLSVPAVSYTSLILSRTELDAIAKTETLSL